MHSNPELSSRSYTMRLKHCIKKAEPKRICMSEFILLEKLKLFDIPKTIFFYIDYIFQNRIINIPIIRQGNK